MSASTMLGTCRLSFLNRWSPESHLYGLKWEEGLAKVDSSLFSCCDGSGMQIQCQQDFRGAAFCGLQLRRFLVTQLIEQWQCYEPTIPFEWPRFEGIPSSGHNLIRQMEAMSLGRLIQEPQEIRSSKIPFAWQAALVLAWHFEVSAFVIRTGRLVHTQNPYLASYEFPKSSQKKLVIFDVSGDPWATENMERLEWAIGFSYERSLPLWIFDRNNKDPVALAKGSTDFKSVIQNRIKQAKSRSVVSWLSTQGLSRLGSVCQIKVEPSLAKKDFSLDQV